MPERLALNTSRPATERAVAFFEVLSTHLDSPVNGLDLQEQYPDLEWSGKVPMIWQQLTAREELQNRLIVFGEGSETMYAMLSHENDITTLNRRLQFMEDHLRVGTGEKTANLWRKRVIALGVVGNTLASGVTLGVYLRNRRKK